MLARFTGVASAIALIASTSAQAAPENSCLPPGEIKGLVAYVIPGVIDGLQKKCSATLRANGYLNTKGRLLAERLSVGKDVAWPMASPAVRKMGGQFKGKSRSALSDRALRAVFDAEMIDTMTAMVPLSTCSDAEAILQTIEPLPDANLIDFVAALYTAASRGERKGGACLI